MVRVAETEIQEESSSVFLEVLQQRLMPVHNYTETFLQTILVCIDNKDPGRTGRNAAKLWCEILADFFRLGRLLKLT